MKLETLQYTEHQGTDRQWSIEPFQLQNVNLLVGQNATGKTRFLNAIGRLATKLTSRTLFGHGDYHVSFKDGEDNIQYKLCMSEGVVGEEEYILNGKRRLYRNGDGRGEVFSSEMGKMMQIGLKPTQVAALAKRDSVQHPFLDRLCSWAESVRHYRFGEDMGRSSMLAINDEDAKNFDKTDEKNVVAIFRDGQKRFGPGLASEVKQDMLRIGYRIRFIGTKQIGGARGMVPPLPGPWFCLYVDEEGVECAVEQLPMSQGMFRALSTSINVNYALFDQTPSSILIDDIGEGLDFERSSKLIRLLMEKVADKNVQLVMTTNDRFVMNNVPLSSWNVILRDGGRCRVLNKRTDPGVFEQFEFTGLNNFDFLATEFWKAEPVE